VGPPRSARSAPPEGPPRRGIRVDAAAPCLDALRARGAGPLGKLTYRRERGALSIAPSARTARRKEMEA